MADQVKQFTKAEVALRNGKNDPKVWIIVKSNVYDVTNFMHQHPGGADLILEYAGKDGTDAFYDIGHSLDAAKQMALHKIGVLIQENSKVYNKQCSTNKTSAKRSLLRAFLARA